jgi:hypothetical protein
MLINGTLKGTKRITLSARSFFDLSSAILIVSQLQLLIRVDTAGYATFVLVLAAYVASFKGLKIFQCLINCTQVSPYGFFNLHILGAVSTRSEGLAIVSYSQLMKFPG